MAASRACIRATPLPPAPSIHRSFASPGTHQCRKNGTNAKLNCPRPVGAPRGFPGAVRWHAGTLAHGVSSELRAQSSEATQQLPVGVRAIVRCPPALLPRSLFRTLLLISMPVARNAGGALCAVRGYRAERAGGGPTGVINTMQARASEFLEHHACVRPCPCHKNATTNTPGTKSHSRGAGRGAARHLRGGDTVPECTV